eukprot:scaffold34621_cov166-Amphora_coffeaeformis.AAC.8
MEPCLTSGDQQKPNRRDWQPAKKDSYFYTVNNTILMATRIRSQIGARNREHTRPSLIAVPCFT